MHAVEAHNTHTQLLTLGATANMYVQRRGGGQWSLVTVLSQPLLACDRDCLRGSIVNTDDPEARCPFAEYHCNSIITEREIRGVSKQTQPSTCRTTTAVHENTPPPSRPLTQRSLY